MKKMIKAESATGHTPGKAATCTEPQTCEKCGTVLELPKGHSYSENIVSTYLHSYGIYRIQLPITATTAILAITPIRQNTITSKTVTNPTCTESRLHNKYLRKLR